MLKKFLSLAVTGSVAFALLGCGDSDSSSQASVQDTPQVGSESSSSEGPASPDPLVSSSSETEPSEIVGLDTLPFDTTGIEPDFYTYTYDELDPFTPEQRAAVGADVVLGRYINALKKVPPFCGIDHIYANGKVLLSYKNGWPGDYKFAILVREDSLMLADERDCKMPAWGACGNVNDYLKKITVGNEVFFYTEIKDLYAYQDSVKEYELIRLTDSTITVWVKPNPWYIEPALDTVALPPPTGWEIDAFEGDSLVTIVGYDSNLIKEYIDTIFIEKYNVKITDIGSTWIFENETCRTADYVPDTTHTVQEQCKERQDYINNGVDCMQRNIGAPEGVYPNLCRPTKKSGDGVWCILDGDYAPAAD